MKYAPRYHLNLSQNSDTLNALNASGTPKANSQIKKDLCFTVGAPKRNAITECPRSVSTTAVYRSPLLCKVLFGRLTSSLHYLKYYTTFFEKMQGEKQKKLNKYYRNCHCKIGLDNATAHSSYLSLIHQHSNIEKFSFKKSYILSKKSY